VKVGVQYPETTVKGKKKRVDFATAIGGIEQNEERRDKFCVGGGGGVVLGGGGGLWGGGGGVWGGF